MDKEEGEMSDDNAMLLDDDAIETQENKEETAMSYKTEKHGIVINKLEKIDAVKLEERAKRFGLCLTGNKVITQKQIDELYENLGVASGNERHFRFDSIHLSGVGGLSTKEIFKYLEDYKPLSLEWIDNVTCNVVCQDHISAALALLVHSMEIEDRNLKQMLSKKSNYYWREGVPFKENLILMRFATNGDEKVFKKKSETQNDNEYLDMDMDTVNKNPWGDLCKSWGVYDHQEVFHRKVTNHVSDDDDTEEPEKYVPVKNKRLAMRLGKRKFTKHSSDNSADSSSDSEWKIKSKTPRMRMHADDEEEKQKKKQIAQVPKEDYTEKYAPLSIEIVNSSGNFKQRESTKLSDKFKYHNTKEQKFGIQSRLGEKVACNVDDYSSDNSASSRHSDCNITSKVKKVGNKPVVSGNIWSRLDVKESNTNERSDLRHIIKSRKKKPDNIRGRLGTDDLRDRLGNSKQSNLRIEIDNTR